MLKREYSLKTRYNFEKVLKQGNTFHTGHLVVKVYKIKDQFKVGIIVSNKFNKSSVVQSKARRIISEAIKKNLSDFLHGFYYVFIPKKNMMSKNDGKIHVDVKTICVEINTFLSKMALSGSKYNSKKVGSQSV